MVDSTVFVGAIIVGVTQFIKLVKDREYERAAVIVAAGIIGALVGLLDTHIGIPDVSIAQGVLTALAAAGVVTTAQKVG